MRQRGQRAESKVKLAFGATGTPTPSPREPAPRASPRSGVDAERQQLVGVLVVQRAQVRQAQQQLGEERAVVRPAAGDERAQSFD